MNIDKVSSGSNVPDEINVIIEIPSQSNPVKYEFDKESGAMFVDRFMSTAMYYPCNYGYIPETLAEDGDPSDVLVITPIPLISGSVISCRPIGLLRMTDESGIDAKILAVPLPKLSPIYDDVKSPDDISPVLISTITHFFEHYKDLEADKWVKVEGWVGVKEAKQEIKDSIERYKK